MIRFALVLATLAACEKKEASDLQDVYAQLSKAVEEGDAEGILASLDLRSRWAVMSVYRSERDIHRLAAQRYRSGPRQREMARYQAAAESGSAAEFFAREYADRLAALRPKLSSNAEFERAEDGKTATVSTATGARLPFALGDDGRWGWTAFREELEARNLWSANALETVRRGASP